MKEQPFCPFPSRSPRVGACVSTSSSRKAESGSAPCDNSENLPGIRVICLIACSSQVQSSEVVHGSITFTEKEEIIYTVNSAVKVNRRRKMPFSTKADKI